MACHLSGAKPVSESVLGLLYIGPFGANCSEICFKITTILMQENVIENIVCKMEAILPWLQCVAVSSGCCALSAIVDDREQLRDIYIDFFFNEYSDVSNCTCNQQGKSEGFDSCDRPSNLKLDSNRQFFRP